ncbi:MAG: HEPN domain-containing protein, partial [Phaeodactylibacter sp.]|nr:HEPN domain-containing protein [Phaeodactylibacter sp.]
VDRAKEALEEAHLLADKDHWNTTANRLYYSCFYMASAYLVLNGKEAFTHNGIKAAFNKELISTDLLSRSYGLLYNKLFNLRQDADYRDYKDLTKEEISPMLLEVQKLLEMIGTLIEEEES